MEILLLMLQIILVTIVILQSQIVNLVQIPQNAIINIFSNLLKLIIIFLQAYHVTIQNILKMIKQHVLQIAQLKIQVNIIIIL